MTSLYPATRPLRTEAEYQAAVAAIDDLVDRNPAEGTHDADHLDLLALLLEAYEEEHEPPVPSVSPQAVVAFMLEQKGLTRADLSSTRRQRPRL